MKKLRVKSKTICQLFGVPEQDTTDEKIIAELIKNGFSEHQARVHLHCAILAGAYEEVNVKGATDESI